MTSSSGAAALPETSADPRPGGLTRTMGSFGALLITLSCLSPSIGVFIVGSDVIRQAGTGVVICFAAAALLGVAMADVYAELGSAFPFTGAEYTILGRVLGPSFGVAVLANNLLGFAIAQSLAGLGVATYLQAVLPGLPAAPVAAALVLTVTAIAVLNIRVNALVTGVCLGVELLALLLVAGLGALHPQRDVLSVLAHPLVLGAGGQLTAPSAALVGAAVSGGIYAFNGYGAAVLLGEEMHAAPRRLAGVVFMALGAAIVTELLPVIAVVAAAPDLHALLASKAPVADFVTALAGPAAGRAMSLGVALAIFNAMIAVALLGGRQLYSTGRDRLWPSRISQAVCKVHPRFGSPYIATLIMGLAALLGCGLDPKILVLVLGNGNVALYAGLCAAALVGRRTGATRHAGYRSPVFPLAPASALVFLLAVVGFDLSDPTGREGLFATALILAAGFAYHRFVLKGRGEWRFRESESLSVDA